MAKSKRNRYSQRAKQSGFIGAISKSGSTKGNVKATLIETGKDLLIGVIGGGLAGAAIGKPSLLIGLGITGLGHYMENRLATMFGFGIMAANGFQSKSVNGFDGLDGAKERVDAYRQSFMQKFYLDALKKKGQTTSGFGQLQYFNYTDQLLPDRYGNTVNGGLEALDAIEQQIEDEGMRRLQMTGTSAYDLEGTSLSEIGDYNL